MDISGRNRNLRSLILLSYFLTFATGFYFPAQAQTVLTLPPGRACENKDLNGIFRLIALAEVPQGSASDSFALNPYQFIYFGEYNVFSRYENTSQVKNRSQLLQHFDTRQRYNLEQFKLSGINTIYFYRDGTAVDSLYCMVVEQKGDPIKKNDMLLYSLNEGRVSLMKIYRRQRFKGGKRN